MISDGLKTVKLCGEAALDKTCLCLAACVFNMEPRLKDCLWNNHRVMQVVVQNDVRMI